MKDIKTEAKLEERHYTVPIFICLRKDCLHRWIARTTYVPRVCPKCHCKSGVMRLRQADTLEVSS